MFDLAAKLRSIARRTTIIGLDIYDRISSESLLPLLAQVIPNPGREKVLELEWVTVTPLLREWVGERLTQKARADKLAVRTKPYEVTYEFDPREAERANSMFQLEQWTRDIMASFARGKVELVDRVLRENLLTYDGQDLFDVSHIKPDGTTYSNIVDAIRVDPDAPTMLEARSEIVGAKHRLLANSLLQTTLVDAEQMAKDLIVITRSPTVYQAYELLRTEDELPGGGKNMLRGTFRHLHSVHSEEVNSVDFIHAAADAPRPTVFVANWEPQGIQFDESKLFSHRLVPFGSDCEFSAAALFPQSTVRVMPE